MTRTHAILVLAAALSLIALVQPAGRWWERHRQEPVVPAPRAWAAGPLRLEAALSHGQPLEGGSTYLRYDVRATDAAPSGPPQAVQLALVIDRSGSMAGEKATRARQAALEFVDLLAPEDELAVVTFGSDTAELALTRADDEGKARMRAFIEGIQVSGGTNLWGGLERAQRLLQAAQVRGVRRVVLMSDGQPTEGRTNVEDLVGFAQSIHEGNLAVSALGIGYDFNASLMQRLAERGGGYYAYLNDPSRLTEVLKLELGQARGAVARNVSLNLELAGGAQLVQVAGREVAQHGNRVVVPLPDFAPGQSAQAFVELRLPAGTTAVQVAARLHFTEPGSDGARLGGAAEVRANTTRDEAVADASKDAKVAAECILAVGSTKMVAAAAAFERGDRTSAFALLANARAIFGQSADALAGDIADATATSQRWQHTHDSQAVAHEAKALTRKKMLSFGANNAY